MKRLAVFLLLLLPGSALSLDRSAFTFNKYELNVRIEPGQQRLAVRGSITLRNDSIMPQKNLVLQISSSLSWVAIQLHGSPLQFASQLYTTDMDHTGALSEAIVSLPQPVAPKQAIELEIGYEGVIAQDTTRLARIGVPIEKARHSDWDRISRSFTAVRGIGYVAWYPVATQAVEMAQASEFWSEIGRWKRREAAAAMDVNLCLAGSGKEDIAIMNDAPAATREAGVKTDHAPLDCAKHSFPKLGDTVPIIAVGNYASAQKSGVALYYLADDQSGLETYGLALDQGMDLVKKLFGERSSADGMRAIDLDDSEAEPFQSATTLLVPFRAKDSVLLLSTVQQMTEGLFSSAQSWVRDGLARYAQFELLEERSSPAEMKMYLEGQSDALRGFESEHAKSGNGGQHNSLPDSLDASYIEAKAASVWWMLKDIVGENQLRSALSKYNPTDDTGPTYVRKLIESEAHRDLAWFFDDWVYHDRGLPDLRIDSVYPRQLPGGGYMVTVTVENLGSAGAEVPVTLRMEPGEEKQRLIVAAKSKASVRIQTAAMPVEATVNDGSVPETDRNNNRYKTQAPASSQ